MKLSKKAKKLIIKMIKLYRKLDKIHPYGFEHSEGRDYYLELTGAKNSKQATIDGLCSGKDNDYKRPFLEKAIKEKK